MSIASQLTDRGTAFHFEAVGEVVLFRGADLIVTINRDPGNTWRNGATQLMDRSGFTENRFSQIDVPIGALDQPPTRNEVFNESNGIRHRIQQIETWPAVIRCKCEVVR